MTPLNFLQSLWQHKPTELFLLIWALKTRQSHWFRDIGAAAEFVNRTDGCDVYMGVGLANRDYGPENRCPSKKIAGIAGLWADFDLKSGAHNKKPLPSTIEDALAIVPAGLQPTITIATGNGVHAWWLFDKPWVFAGDEEHEEASVLSSRFQTLLQYNSSQRGWAFDRLRDLARVLRIPGTINAKDPTNLKEVAVYSTEGRRYDPAEIREYLDRLAIPDPETQDRASKDWAQQFADAPLIIDLTAAIPDDLLSTWINGDMRFRDTWKRERQDMSDQSGSGYDMALACFGINNGLSDQQIVDLIVQHRRNHGEQRRTRLDYFQRTISKAAKKIDSTRLRSAGAALAPPCPHADPNSGEGAASSGDGSDDPTIKAKLCDQISRLLGIRLIRLVKVPGKEPVFLMELEEGRIEFDINKLLSQKSVSLALAGKVRKIIPTFKPTQWRELAQMMLDACTEVEGTDDLELEGSARIQLAKYLADGPFIPSINGVTAQDLHRPMVYMGRITISTTDFQTYINRTTMQNHSVRYVAAMIAALGGEAVRVRGNSFKEQSRWALPVGEFDPAAYQVHQEADGDGE